MKRFDPSKAAFPLTLEDNVFLVESSWYIFFPDGSTYQNNKFKMKDGAQQDIDLLNEAYRRRGGRPKKVKEAS